MDAPYDGTEVTVVSEEMETGFVFAATGTQKKKKKKKKYKGAGDQGDKAKRPRSAYLLYYYDIYLKVQQELPNLPQSEINKKISESWRLLSVAEKSYYLEKAKIEKEGQEPNSTSAAVPDVPGFRKILPRSNYIIIPRSSSLEDSRQRKELRLVQGRCTSGADAVHSPISLLREAEQSLLALNPCRSGMTEQCISLEELVHDVNSFQETDVVQEVVTSEIFPTYLGAMSSKPSGDPILDESALKLGEGHSKVATDLAVEDEESGCIAAVPLDAMSVVQMKMDDVVTALAVKAEPLQAGCSVSSPNDFIVLPVPPRTSSETVTSIKLATTYTRRGRGNCTNPGCSYTYVTRHKPPKCPLCDTFLGGKWIPKEKSRLKSVASHVNFSTAPREKLHQTDTPQPAPMEKSVLGSAEESLAAVSQLLNVVPDGCKTEWEEVNISDAQVLQRDCEGKSRPVTVTHLPTEITCTKASSVASTVGVHSSLAPVSTKVEEIRNKSRPRTALLAAARPIRAIRPAPPSPCRMASSQSLDQKRACIKNGIHSLVQATGLKLSTLKQLGHTVQLPTRAEEKNVQVVPVTRLPPFPSKLLEVYPEGLPSYKYSCMATMDLGLATSRGRGKCKNPACSYVYTNRHKPPYCPSCGHNLCKERIGKIIKPQGLAISAPEMLTFCNSLSQSQKEIQRLSTLQLLRKVVQVPENETELTEVLALIHELNSSRFILSDVSEETVTIEQTSWSNYYESPADECLLCGSPLFKGEKNSLAAPQECWLLTANRLQVVTAQVKMCLNPQCLALHSFTDIYTGLFNLGNKLLVSLDLLFTIRNHVKLGDDPNVSIRSVLLSVQEQTEKVFSSDDGLLLHELLRNCYWAFECLTVRDYNDMICGVCGIAPKVEIAQRNMKNTLALKNIEFTWPEFEGSGEVNVEDFWFTMEMEVIEQAAFPSGIPITKFDAAIIAPFFAPLMRGTVVVNTEKDKNVDHGKVTGNSSALVRLLQEGSLKLEQANSYDEEQLRHFLALCDIPCEASDTKDIQISSLLALHSYVQNGSGTRQPPGSITGGKVYKVCPHQVVCGSKYIVRGENARDHVDLLVSSRHWPPVYVVDIATQVALCADTCYPDLTAQMWGQNQGCFSNPMEPPLYVSSPELLDQHYNMDMTVSEPSLLHPITKSTCRRVVHAGGKLSSHTDMTVQHRSLSLCRELEPYKAIVSAIHDSKTSMVRQQAITFDNATHYYLYNRLIDFLTSREIVNRQIHEIVQNCQPGEVVIRDTLYRLGVAQIKTEESMDEEEEVEVEENLSDHILEPH